MSKKEEFMKKEKLFKTQVIQRTLQDIGQKKR